MPLIEALSSRDIFVLNYFQDCLYSISLFICLSGVFFTTIAFCIFMSKKHKQSKDIHACALLFFDIFSNITGIYYILTSLCTWGYTSFGCRSGIYLWRLEKDSKTTSRKQHNITYVNLLEV